MTTDFPNFTDLTDLPDLHGRNKYELVLITEELAAKELNMPVSCLKDLVRAGYGPLPYKMGGGIVYALQDVLALRLWLSRRDKPQYTAVKFARITAHITQLDTYDPTPGYVGVTLLTEAGLKQFFERFGDDLHQHYDEDLLTVYGPDQQPQELVDADPTTPWRRTWRDILIETE